MRLVAMAFGVLVSASALGETCLLNLPENFQPTQQKLNQALAASHEEQRALALEAAELFGAEMAKQVEVSLCRNTGEETLRLSEYLRRFAGVAMKFSSEVQREQLEVINRHVLAVKIPNLSEFKNRQREPVLSVGEFLSLSLYYKTYGALAAGLMGTAFVMLGTHPDTVFNYIMGALFAPDAIYLLYRAGYALSDLGKPKLTDEMWTRIVDVQRTIEAMKRNPPQDWTSCEQLLTPRPVGLSQMILL